MERSTARKRTLLVVEDEPDVRETTTLLLEFVGYIVRGAPDGEAALRMLAEAPVDGVLLDVTMPRLDGDATLARIRETDVRTPVILCSGREPSEDRHGVRERGPTGFLLKPYTLDELTGALAAFGL